MRVASILLSATAIATACSAPLDASGANRSEQRGGNTIERVNGYNSLDDPTHEQACSAAWSAMPAIQKEREGPKEAFLGLCARGGRWVMICADGWIEYGPEPALCARHGGSEGTFWQPDG